MPCDYKQYPPDWKTHIVPAIRKRSGGRCEGSPKYPGCRAIDKQPHPETGGMVCLTTAHMDHDKDNNQYHPTDPNAPGNNLRHLCNRCHLAHDLAQHINNRRWGRNWKKNQLFFDF